MRNFENNLKYEGIESQDKIHQVGWGDKTKENGVWDEHLKKKKKKSLAQLNIRFLLPKILMTYV